MTPRRTIRSPARRTLAAAGAALLLTACSDTALQEAAPAEDPGAEVDGGAVGPDVRVDDDLGLQQVQLASPRDGVYEAGEDARLYVAVTNTGTDPVVLTDVSGPDFAGVDVQTEGGGGLPLTVDPDGNLYVGAQGPPVVTLQDLGRELGSSQSIPVTFTFAEAGEVTVDVMVSAEEDPGTPFDFPNEDPEVRPDPISLPSPTG
ncbi:copper chaperone PCu(A)C [Geodermatophilus sp. DSM 44513]|uniref:copper chaperone PCu(A)C n=1 Tax=Geodermatophilus sp. DSM 44513 TaxID=1528104 RepID=UPI00128ADB2E|nr:copper chaperone PCu(A)C [Geodermatophilus sp. DSM 44513]WNV73641.1 copper chaperone PCu(A)C [Geodermatophilus sp. DSM 44513]